MPKASMLTADSYTQILMKSSPGFGKTLAACSFALDGPVWLAYFDKKKPIELLQYFKRFGAKGKKILDNIEYDIYGAHNAHEYLNKVIRLSQRCDYFAVVTDSATWMTSSAVNWSLGFRDSKNRKTDKLNPQAPAIIPDFDEYKVETSLVTQALDIQKELPCHVIWTAHPLPTLKLEGSGSSMKVTKSNSIVTYGSKVAGMIPGAFTEIYHFSQLAGWDSVNGKAFKKFYVNTESVGDEFAKSAIFDNYIKEFDITDKLFYEVWKQLVKEAMAIPEAIPEAKSESETTALPPSSIANPFAQTQQANQPKQWKI